MSILGLEVCRVDPLWILVQNLEDFKAVILIHLMNLKYMWKSEYHSLGEIFVHCLVFANLKLVFERVEMNTNWGRKVYYEKF